MSTKRRLLIVGAGGFLGQHLARRAAACFDVYQGDLGLTPGEHAVAMDITASGSVNAAFEQTAPDAVVLLAAVSDIDLCESRPDLAEAVNVGGTGHVAEACARAGARLVFLSSAAVFDGTQQGYRESDGTKPLSVYGRTKVCGEQLVARKLPSALILRLALVVGFAEGSGTNAMLNKFTAKLRAGERVSLPDFEYRNPIDPDRLSEFIVELVGLEDAAGIFHIGAQQAISRFELGQRLADGLGYSRDLVRPQSEPLPGRAPRGLDHFLLTERIRAICRTPIPTCGEVIERAIHGSSQSNL